MHNAANKMYSAADTMRGAANTMCGAATVMHVRWVGWWVGQNQSLTPHMAKNKFLLNEYLGIFMHFESIFFYFFKSGKWTFSDPPTH